jgi:hypothetical protein
MEDILQWDCLAELNDGSFCYCVMGNYISYVFRCHWLIHRDIFFVLGDKIDNSTNNQIISVQTKFRICTDLILLSICFLWPEYQ